MRQLYSSIIIRKTHTHGLTINRMKTTMREGEGEGEREGERGGERGRERGGERGEREGLILLRAL